MKLLTTVLGVLTILFAVIGLSGYAFDIKHINRFFDVRWLKGNSENKKQLTLYYTFYSMFLLIIGFVLILSDVELKSPFLP